MQTSGGPTLRDLGDGLVLRQATVEDTEALVAFNAGIHVEPEDTEPNTIVGEWTRDLMRGNHPTFKVGDFTVVEDTRTGEIVSSSNLISQTWTYEGIEFGVGRPEIVGTHIGYRNKGLVRAQFDVLHQWSAERGEMAQAITGIPFYYRQFGYEMGLDLGGGRIGYRAHVPKLKEGDSEPYRIRPATAEDIPTIMELHDQGAKRGLIAAVRDEALWRYELEGRGEKSAVRKEVRIIETQEGETVGMFAYSPFLWGNVTAIVLYELRPGSSWVQITPVVVRYIKSVGEEHAAREKKEEWAGFGFWLGREHPVYAAFESYLPRIRKPYAWYIRVPDLPGFIRRITPALERRLDESVAAGYTGKLEISFYRDGFALVFDKGRISVEPWKPTPESRGAAGFPDLTFLQLVFGYRTLDELQYAYADCWAREDGAAMLLKAIFPTKSSNVIAVEWA